MNSKTLPFAKWLLSGMLLAVWSGAGQADPATSRQSAENSNGTPFLWGVANAAFQVEGSPAPSDFASWLAQPGKVADGTTPDVVTDFYHRYDTDFALAQGLGANAFRISIPWERIEPAPGVFDEEQLAHYEAVIGAMRARGLEPVVTLHHYVLPPWLAAGGGLLAPGFAKEFADYAEAVVARLGRAPARVQWWITINEPMVLAEKAYGEGTYPPGHKQPLQVLLAAKALARAHVAAATRIRALGLPVKIGIAQNWTVFDPATGSVADKLLCSVAAELFNRQFVRALVTGSVRLAKLGPAAKAEYPLVAEQLTLPADGSGTLDFLGINNYGRTLVGLSSVPPYFVLPPGPGPKTDLGYEIYPDGLKRAVTEAAVFKLPILVTENGVPDHSDSFRGAYLEAALAGLLEAKKSGVPVFGYLHWSLTDDFEWNEGLAPRFGLVAVDYTTLARTPRPSYETYRQIILSNRNP